MEKTIIYQMECKRKIARTKTCQLAVQSDLIDFEPLITQIPPSGAHHKLSQEDCKRSVEGMLKEVTST